MAVLVGRVAAARSGGRWPWCLWLREPSMEKSPMQTSRSTDYGGEKPTEMCADLRCCDCHKRFFPFPFCLVTVRVEILGKISLRCYSRAFLVWYKSYSITWVIQKSLLNSSWVYLTNRWYFENIVGISADAQSDNRKLELSALPAKTS